MDIQTRLSLLDQHLSLLIESTESCDTLTGESVAATLFVIQEQLRKVLNQEKEPNSSPRITMAAKNR